MKFIGENEVRIQLKESTGPMGPAGPQGPKGDKGDRGEPGPRGLTGETGPKGDKGDKGERGETGATGAQGPQGEKGEKGETGATGAQGPKGEKGETGATGPHGPQGIQGETGPQGEQGPQGEKGEKGDKGDTGPQGPAGSIDNLPIASATQIGGVKPVAATEEMTQDVGVTSDGRLKAPAVAAPSAEQIKTAVDAFLTENPVSSPENWELLADVVTNEDDINVIKVDVPSCNEYFVLAKIHLMADTSGGIAVKYNSASATNINSLAESTWFYNNQSDYYGCAYFKRIDKYIISQYMDGGNTGPSGNIKSNKCMFGAVFIDNVEISYLALTANYSGAKFRSGAKLIVYGRGAR